jgi:hypothetical protein
MAYNEEHAGIFRDSLASLSGITENNEPNMPKHPVVSSEQWLAARQELLQKEKWFTR